MTVTISIDGDQATLTFEKTAGTAVVADTADSAARYIYPIRWQLYDESGEEPVPIPYDDLTNNQKLAVLDKEITFHLRSMARTDWIGDAIDTARETAEEEAEEKFDLE